MANRYVPQNPCPVCQSERTTRVIHVVDTACWSDRCHAPMKVAFGDEEGYSFSPEEFTEDEVQAARAAGAILEERFSKTVKSEYMANVCPRCNMIVGSFFLHRYGDLANDKTIALSRESCAKCEGRDDDDEHDDEHEGEHDADVADDVDADHADDADDGNDADDAFDDEQQAPYSATGASRIDPPSRKPAAVLWGKCGHCGAVASPRTVNNGRFFCTACNTLRAFIPDAK